MPRGSHLQLHVPVSLASEKTRLFKCGDVV